MFDTEFLNELRREELRQIRPHLGDRGRLLEFGAGTGAQAVELQNMGFEVTAIDLAGSGYSDSRVYPVIDYDGNNIPVPDHSLDVVFSSNVLEHVPHLDSILAEFSRVLRPGGCCVHVMPSVSWRAWTFASGFANAVPAALKLVRGLAYGNRGRRVQGLLQDSKVLTGCVLPIGHGVSPEGLSELFTFSATYWRRKFERGGFSLVKEQSLHLFHTGHMLFGRNLSIASRRRLSRYLGGAARIYVTSPTACAPDTPSAVDGA